MTYYEDLLEKASMNGVSICENYDFSGTRIKGLYCDGAVALSKELCTESEKCCVLAEEIGHHLTSFGNIIDLSDASNRKQELRARAWAYTQLLPLSEFVSAYEDGCSNRFELAEHAGVTEDFLDGALAFYRNRYETFATVGAYAVFFEPLVVVRLPPGCSGATSKYSINIAQD